LFGEGIAIVGLGRPDLLRLGLPVFGGPRVQRVSIRWRPQGGGFDASVAAADPFPVSLIAVGNRPWTLMAITPV